MTGSQRSASNALPVALGAVAALLFGMAEAQSSNVPATSEADHSPLETVVVTARKRNVLLRDVPSTVNLIDEKTLENARIQDIEGAAQLVPGLELGKFTGEALGLATIRGVSPQTFGDPTVVVFQDGFAFGNSTRAVTSDIFDLERVEVLKGPQSTLYGANSLGGTINLISRKPSRELEARARASYGRYDSFDVHASLSGPIVADRLAVRLTGGTRQRDGYWDNVFSGERRVDGSRQDNARFAALWTPDDAFESYLIYAFSRTEADCGDCTNPLIGFDPLDPGQVGSGQVGPDRLGPFVNQNVLGYFERDVHRVTWENTYDAGRFSVTSLTGYAEMKIDGIADLDRSPGNIFGIVDTQFPADFDILSQELRFTSNDVSRLKWLVGAFYSVSDGTTSSLFNFGAPPRFLAGSSLQEFDNLALFADNSYALGDSLDLGFGLRYDRAKKALFDNVTLLSNSATTSEWLPKLSLTWRADATTNVYGVVSKGYKTGGFNPSSNLAPIPSGYEPEFLWNYEVGVKGTAAGRSVAYEVAAYYIDWKDQQVQQATGIQTFITNAGSTEIYGAELSVHYTPTAQLAMHLGMSYNHARYRQYFDSTAVPTYFGADPDRSGSPTFLAPDWTGVLSAQYVHWLTSGLNLTGRADVRYTGERSLDTAGIMRGDPYTLVNLFVSIGSETMRLGLYANNVFDERYATAGSLFANIQPLVHLGDPRVVGLQLDLNF